MQYINDRKVKLKEGELRCKDLAAYLESINAPKSVWISEDASGIIAKAVYDVKTNQLIGLTLPLDQTTGIPISNTFLARTLEEIEKNMLQPKSNYVYIVVAQPVVPHASPFILQLFGTDNKFRTSDVLKRWKTMISELKKYAICLTLNSLVNSIQMKL